MKGRKLTDILEYNPHGYNTDTGIFVPNMRFIGDFEQELATQTFYDVPVPQEEVTEIDNTTGVRTVYRNLSFKSADGHPATYHGAGEFWQEERAEDFQWTSAYYECPQIRKMLDWFQIPMARVRVFSQNPDQHMPLHTDFDNQKDDNIDSSIVRIVIQLNENNNCFYHRFKTGDSDITIQMQKGQWMIFNADKVGHETINVSQDRQRDSFIILAKRNKWLDDIVAGNVILPAEIDCR